MFLHIFDLGKFLCHDVETIMVTTQERPSSFVTIKVLLLHHHSDKLQQRANKVSLFL